MNLYEEARLDERDSRNSLFKEPQILYFPFHKFYREHKTCLTRKFYFESQLNPMDLFKPSIYKIRNLLSVTLVSVLFEKISGLGFRSVWSLELLFLRLLKLDLLLFSASEVCWDNFEFLVFGGHTSFFWCPRIYLSFRFRWLVFLSWNWEEIDQLGLERIRYSISLILQNLHILHSSESLFSQLDHSFRSAKEISQSSLSHFSKLSLRSSSEASYLLQFLISHYFSSSAFFTLRPNYPCL